MIFETVSQKGGITARDLFNQPTFTSILKNFIRRIKTCATEAQQTGVLYHPGIR